MTFREGVRRDIGWRLLDVALHITAACLLHSWTQWLPDMMLLVIWPLSMVQNKRLPDDCAALELHRWFHSVLCLVALWSLVLWVVPGIGLLYVIAANWTVHICIDYLTHRGWNELLRAIQ